MNRLSFSALITVVGIVMIPVWIILAVSAMATFVVCWPIEKLLLKGGS